MFATGVIKYCPKQIILLQNQLPELHRGGMGRFPYLTFKATIIVSDKWQECSH